MARPHATTPNRRRTGAHIADAAHIARHRPRTVANVAVAGATAILAVPATLSGHPANALLPALGYGAIMLGAPRFRDGTRRALESVGPARKARADWEKLTTPTGEGEDATVGLAVPTSQLGWWWTGQHHRRPSLLDAYIDGDQLVVKVERLGHPESVWRAHRAAIAEGLHRGRPVLITMHPNTVELRLPPAGKTGLSEWEPTMPEPIDIDDPQAVAAFVDMLGAAPVARNEDGELETQKLLGSHILVAGETGAGKSSIEWSAVNEIAPGIPHGLVELRGIDGKAGTELSMAREMFTVFCGEIGAAKDQAIVDTLKDLYDIMCARLKEMNGVSRKHVPRPGSPFIFLVYDELLTSNMGMVDASCRKLAEQYVTLLLSQGRAAGVSIMSSIQIGQKSAIGATRDLYPDRILLRVADKIQIDMCLGAGAWERGAKAELIDVNERGTAYLLREARDPVLVRFPKFTDEYLRELARRFPAPVQDEIPAVREIQTAVEESPQPEPEAPSVPSRGRRRPQVDALAEAIADPLTDALKNPELARRLRVSLSTVEKNRARLVREAGRNWPPIADLQRRPGAVGDPTYGVKTTRADTPDAVLSPVESSPSGASSGVLVGAVLGSDGRDGAAGVEGDRE